ncbi:MAG: PEGA domain-containing protein [Candidatus Neomarinimicrobiota bacterium]
MGNSHIFFKRILILILLTCTVNAQSNDRRNLALYDFESRGVSTIEAQVISDRIRIEIGRLEAYNIIERGLMEEVLTEQAFQLTGACTESSCLVEVGRMLAVHYIVGGSVSKIGNLFTIEARIIDVESGNIVKNVIEDYNGPIENLLVQTTKVVAAKLSGTDEGQAALLLTGTCDLLVQSNPLGGTIYINDKPMGDVTPYRLEGLREGDYTIKVRKGNLVGRLRRTSRGRNWGFSFKGQLVLSGTE